MTPAEAVRAEAGRRAGRGDRLLNAEHVAGWLFVSPGVLLIGLFGLVPVIWSFVLSFQRNDLVTPGDVGRAGQLPALGPRTRCSRASVRHTVVYTALFVPDHHRRRCWRSRRR